MLTSQTHTLMHVQSHRMFIYVAGNYGMFSWPRSQPPTQAITQKCFGVNVNRENNRDTHFVMCIHNIFSSPINTQIMLLFGWRTCIRLYVAHSVAMH